MISFVVFISTLVYVMSKAFGLSALSMSGFALVLAGAMSIGSFYYSDKLVIATSGAKQIKKDDIISSF